MAVSVHSRLGGITRGRRRECAELRVGAGGSEASRGSPGAGGAGGGGALHAVAVVGRGRRRLRRVRVRRRLRRHAGVRHRRTCNNNDTIYIFCLMKIYTIKNTMYE